MIEQASLVLGNGNWAVKSDSLLGYKTIDGKYYPREFTFTRATTGTRVNEAGLVEVVPYNLFQYSEQFDNAYWQKLNGGIGLIPTVTANTATSPSGTLTADRIQLSLNGGTSGNDISYINTNVSTTAATFSIYAKSNTTPCTIYFRSGSTITTINITTEWQRFELYSSGAITIAQFGLRGGSYGGAVNSNTADISVWGAQLVEGTEPLDYLPTTDRLDIPRIDYSTGEPVLLLEPQRTNLALQSSSFSNAYWTKSNSSVTSGFISPDGTLNAFKLVGNAATGVSNINGSFTSSAADYSSSFYVKPSGKQFIQILWSSGQSTEYSNFDLINGIVTQGNGKISNIGNGWFRISLTTSLSAAAGQTFLWNIDSGTSTRAASSTGDGTSGIYIYGAQVEVGSYATSYIPTTSASVTRNADVCVKTGASAFIGQTEGTVYMEIMNDGNDSVKVPIRISNSLGQTEFDIGFNQLYQFRFDLYNAGVFVANIMGTPAAPLGLNKLAVAYQSGNYALSLNGSLLTNNNISKTYTSLLDRLTIGLAGNNFINQATLFKTRLSNSELQQLTTL